ncbi:MAG: type III pantothenate kinase [Gemmatimonadota bacterium]|nr:type III pantothenate kinase [Gemmatimonadota bacterium]
MLFVGDIGNSQTVLGLRADDGSVVRRWRIHTEPRTPDELGILLRALLASDPDGPPRLDACCFASVVPHVTGAMIEAARRYLDAPAHEFRWSPELGIDLVVEEPDQVGPDRVANTLAAHLAYPGPAIVVDLGTATNFDVVSAEGAFLGGLIAPGVESGAATLSGGTALLPDVAPGFPASTIGKTTVEHMQIGIYTGACAMIEGLVERLREEWEPDPTVIAAGGLAPLFADRCGAIDVVDPDLTIKGVGWGHDRIHPPEA